MMKPEFVNKQEEVPLCIIMSNCENLIDIDKVLFQCYSNYSWNLSSRLQVLKTEDKKSCTEKTLRSSPLD